MASALNTLQTEQARPTMGGEGTCLKLQRKPVTELGKEACPLAFQSSALHMDETSLIDISQEKPVLRNAVC